MTSLLTKRLKMKFRYWHELRHWWATWSKTQMRFRPVAPSGAFTSNSRNIASSVSILQNCLSSNLDTALACCNALSAGDLVQKGCIAWCKSLKAAKQDATLAVLRRIAIHVFIVAHRCQSRGFQRLDNSSCGINNINSATKPLIRKCKGFCIAK